MRYRIVYSVLVGSEPARINYLVWNVDAKNHLDAITDFRRNFPNQKMESIVNVTADKIVWDASNLGRELYPNKELKDSVVLGFKKKETKNDE